VVRATIVTGSPASLSSLSIDFSTPLSSKFSTTTFWSISPRVRPIRCWVTSVMYSQVLSSKVSCAVGDPIIADTSALVDVPGVSSFMDSGSTRLPRNCGGGISHPQDDSSRHDISIRRRRLVDMGNCGIPRILVTGWLDRRPVLSIGTCHGRPGRVNEHAAIGPWNRTRAALAAEYGRVRQVGRFPKQTLQARTQCLPALRSAVAAARDPYLYATLGVPDTLDGRFDAIVLHVYLIVRRLGGDPGPALAQAVFDAMFLDMDINLREMGVGDLSVGKRNRAMWEAFHGRSAAYAAVWTMRRRWRRLFARNFWRGRTAIRFGRGAGPAGGKAGGEPCRTGHGCPVAGRCPVFTSGGGRAMTPEFHRPVSLDRIGSLGLEYTVEAKPAECAALAERMQIPAVLALSLRVPPYPEGRDIAWRAAC